MQGSLWVTDLMSTLLFPLHLNIYWKSSISECTMLFSHWKKKILKLSFQPGFMSGKGNVQYFKWKKADASVKIFIITVANKQSY